MYAFYFVFDVLLYLLYCHITYCLHNIVSDHPVLLLLKIDWLIDWLMSLGCGLGAPSLVLVWGLPSLGLGSQNLDLGLGFETPVSCSWSWSWKSKYRSNSNSNNQIYIAPYASCSICLDLGLVIPYHYFWCCSWNSQTWSCSWGSWVTWVICSVLGLENQIHDLVRETSWSWSWSWFWDSRVLFLV